MKECSGVNGHNEKQIVGYLSEHRDIGDWPIGEAKLDSVVNSPVMENRERSLVVELYRRTLYRSHGALSERSTRSEFIIEVSNHKWTLRKYETRNNYNAQNWRSI
jgi:hypothetical protein